MRFCFEQVNETKNVPIRFTTWQLLRMPGICYPKVNGRNPQLIIVSAGKTHLASTTIRVEHLNDSFTFGRTRTVLNNT